MKLIINSNPIFSAFIASGNTRKLLFTQELELITTDYALDEIRKYEELICTKGNISQEEFQILILLLFEKIIIIPQREYNSLIRQAGELITDKDDVPFLALALATKNDGIWSNDARFKEQKEVRIWSTKELLDYFGLL